MGEDDAAAEVRRRYGIPEAVRLRVDDREVLAWLAGAEDAVRTVAADPDGLSAGDVLLRGRGTLSRLDSPLGPLVVREYRKGGMLRHVRGRRFRGAYRPLAELVLHRRCLGAGVPVPEGVGAVVLKGAFGWRGFLLMREVEASQDLEAWLYARGGAEPRGMLRAAGRAVRLLHDAGVSHADLHAKNLLYDPRPEARPGKPGAAADPRVLVIDLDRARTFDGALPDAERFGNLLRLGRSLEKHRLRGLAVPRRLVLRFLEGYAGDRATAAAWLERLRARLRQGLWVRTLWWRLTGQARRPRAALAGEAGGAAA